MAVLAAATDRCRRFGILRRSDLVGGSPPYGGISYDEAAAVFELLEDFRGPSQASDASYSKVESFIEGRPECVHALDA